MITTCIAVAALLFALIALACAAGQFVLTAKVQAAADKIIGNWEDRTAKVDLSHHVEESELEAAETERHWYRKNLN